MTTPNSRATLKLSCLELSCLEPLRLEPLRLESLRLESLRLESLCFAQIVSCIIVLDCNFCGQVRAENDEEVAEA